MIAAQPPYGLAVTVDHGERLAQVMGYRVAEGLQFAVRFLQFSGSCGQGGVRFSICSSINFRSVMSLTMASMYFSPPNSIFSADSSPTNVFPICP